MENIWMPRVNYSGSVLDFDVDSMASASNYFEQFKRLLKKKGYKAEQMILMEGEKEIKQTGNCLVINGTYYIYFQGSGNTSWWNWQKSIIARIAKHVSAQESAFGYLVLSRNENGVQTYYTSKMTEQDYTLYNPEEKEKRFWLSGDPAGNKARYFQKESGRKKEGERL